MNSGGIVVVGSLNMDFVVAVNNLPVPGETVLGNNFQMIPGGKGANQAFAAALLAGKEVQVSMIGRVGRDLFGDQLKSNLFAVGVDVNAVQTSASRPTGVAMIAVEASGQNVIVVASGANLDFTPAELDSLRRIFHGARVALFQLETPLDTVAEAMRLAHEEGVTTILDPAPAQSLPDGFLEYVDILTPNEVEAATLAPSLQVKRPRLIIYKLGENGCSVDNGTEQVRYPAFPVTARDTTAAGDTFNAALAVALAENQQLPSAIRFANAAAAISVTRAGAQSSAPSRAEVEALLRSSLG